MVKVEHSAMIRGGKPAPAISFAVAIKASGFGRLVMTIGQVAATSFALRTIQAPALVSSFCFFGSTSKPMTRHPALIRLRVNEPPMMPSPITPTDFIAFAIVPTPFLDTACSVVADSRTAREMRQGRSRAKSHGPYFRDEA